MFDDSSRGRVRMEVVWTACTGTSATAHGPPESCREGFAVPGFPALAEGRAG